MHIPVKNEYTILCSTIFIPFIFSSDGNTKQIHPNI